VTKTIGDSYFTGNRPSLEVDEVALICSSYYVIITMRMVGLHAEIWDRIEK